MVLVVGSTGTLGSRVVRKLLSGGKPATAVVRDDSSEKAKVLESLGARLVVGDVKNTVALWPALQGIATIVCTVSATMSGRDGDPIEIVDGKGVQGLIVSAEKAGVERFIYVSLSPNLGAYFPLAAAKRAAEKRLAGSKLAYTILQPSYFYETWFSPLVGFDWANGQVKVYGDGQALVSYLSTEDVARAVVSCLDNPDVSRRSFPMGGPRALSQREAVAIFEQATGKKMEIEYMSSAVIDGVRSTSTDTWSNSLFALFQGLVRGDRLPETWDPALKVQPSITVEDYAKQVVTQAKAVPA